MNRNHFLSPPAIVFGIALICVAILAATSFGPHRPETMVSAATTASSAATAGATITPTVDAGY